MKTLGQVAFETYNAAMGGVAYDGSPIPGWGTVKPVIRNGWEAAAAAVRDCREELKIHAVLEERLHQYIKTLVTIPEHEDRRLYLTLRARELVWVLHPELDSLQAFKLLVEMIEKASHTDLVPPVSPDPLDIL